MFVPYGFLLTALTASKCSAFKCTFFSSLLFSLTIEILQLVLVRGLFEWDDVINNVVGAAGGFLLYEATAKLATKEKRPRVLSMFCVAFVVVCAGVLFCGRDEVEEQGNLSQEICFQIDKADDNGSMLMLDGFCFVFNTEPREISIILKSTASGSKSSFNTKYGIKKSEVQKYFRCEYDYTHTGFEATGEIKQDEEYEVMVKFPWSVPIPTGVYYSSSGIHYVPERSFKAPDLEESFIVEGTLRAYRPDYCCWVYQYRDSIYWIANQNFAFENQGKTYIQYQLWTTQPERLPEKRIEKGLTWDNIGGNFEDYELHGLSGKYRVMKRGLPTNYSITSITTGYYKNGKWIWKDDFRPIYEFKELCN